MLRALSDAAMSAEIREDCDFFFDYGGTQVLLKESDANNVCIKAKEQIFFKLIFCDNFSEPVLPSCADK